MVLWLNGRIQVYRTGPPPCPALANSLPPRYASRVIHQSAIDWLFNAIARTVSPATLAVDESIPAHEGASEIYGASFHVHPDPAEAAEKVLALLNQRRDKLGINKKAERKLMDMKDRRGINVEADLQ